MRRAGLLVVFALVVSLLPTGIGGSPVPAAIAAEPTAEPAPTAQPEPTAQLEPTARPEPTGVPGPTVEPVPVPQAEATPAVVPSEPATMPTAASPAVTPEHSGLPEPGVGVAPDGNLRLEAIDEPTVTFIYAPPSELVVNREATIQAWLYPNATGGDFALEIDGTVVDTAPAVIGFVALHWRPAVVGPVVMTVSYSGATGLAPSTSDPVNVAIVSPYPTRVDVSVSPTYTVVRNTPAHLTATVVPDPGAGTVDFYVDGVVVGSSDLTDGSATFDVSIADVGYHSIAARFNGNSSWSARSGNAPARLMVIGDPITLGLSVASDPLPSGPVTVKAALGADPGGGTIYWEIEYSGLSGSAPVGPGGVTELSLGTFSGTYLRVLASFDGYGTWGPASSTLAFQVGINTSTSITSNRSTAVAGELPVTLTATVDEAGDNTSVTFLDDVGGSIIELGPVPIDSAGTAKLTTSGLRVGTHSIRARYNGDNWLMPSVSEPITVTIVADTSVHATFKASLAKLYAHKDGYRDTVSLGGVLDERASVTVKVYASSGSLKRTWSLGWKNAGAYGLSWNGRTSGGKALPAGKYTAKATFKDVKGHLRTITVSTALSWRQAKWVTATTVVRYGDQLSYFGTDGSGLYYSEDYSRGAILDAGSMSRDCEPSCNEIWGTATFGLRSKSVLDYRRVDVQVTGHGFTDREHSGTGYIVNPATGGWMMELSLPEYIQSGVTHHYTVSKSQISAARKVTIIVYCTEMWGDAFDLHHLKLTYQYAVWK